MKITTYTSLSTALLLATSIHGEAFHHSDQVVRATQQLSSKSDAQPSFPEEVPGTAEVTQVLANKRSDVLETKLSVVR